jgi:hypothetical protein
MGITPPPLNAQTCPNPYLTGAATYVGGPIQLSSGGSGDAASALNGPTSTAVSNVKQVSAAAVSKKLLAKKKGGALAAPGQEFGTALDAEVAKLLTFSGPTAGILFGTLAFLGVLIIPPLLIAMRRRHVAAAAAADSAAPASAAGPPGGDGGAGPLQNDPLSHEGRDL